MVAGAVLRHRDSINRVLELPMGSHPDRPDVETVRGLEGV